VCKALFRCCDGASQTDYFGPWAQNTLLAAFKSKLPPSHAFADEAECAATVKGMMEITPFGDWVTEAKAGHVTFDAAAADVCKTALDSAACGVPVASALTDGTCFGFAAPPGGDLQRKSFQRVGKVGDACVPIHDGVGTAFYGTCDPKATFCCYDDAAKPGKCGYPYDANANARSGSCKAASANGAACALSGSLQLCTTGSSCDGATNHCVADGTAQLNIGDDCVDGSFNLLGICQASYCDVLGTGKCEALKVDGAACMGPEECANGACVMGACGASTFCVGP
jgi:hypothetical protein